MAEHPSSPQPHPSALAWARHIQRQAEGAWIALVAMAVASIVVMVPGLPPEAILPVPFVILGVLAVVALPLIYTDWILLAIEELREQRDTRQPSKDAPARWPHNVEGYRG